MAVTKASPTMHFSNRNHAAAEPATGRWTPNTDIYTTDSGLVIKTELAGMKSDSLEIGFHTEMLPQPQFCCGGE